jgi:hypothetical protein
MSENFHNTAQTRNIERTGERRLDAFDVWVFNGAQSATNDKDIINIQRNENCK